MSNAPPIGQRFSHVYLQRGEPAQDSPRMRRRLAALVWATEDLRDFGPVVSAELGVDVPYSMVYDWRSFFASCDLQDVLDVITVGWRHLEGKFRTGIRDVNAPTRWVREAHRIFTEENVHYRVDERGGVHFNFDEEFARSEAATIASLQAPRYQNTLTSFRNAMADLGKAPPDCKSAIRDTFAAAEGLFRLMFSGSPRLTAQEAQKLETVLQVAHATDKVALSAAMKLLNSFKDWIDAAHFYRHEAGREDPVQPPLTLVVHMVSVGASFIRWLAELDAVTQVKLK